MESLPTYLITPEIAALYTEKLAYGHTRIGALAPGKGCSSTGKQDARHLGSGQHRALCSAVTGRSSRYQTSSAPRKRAARAPWVGPALDRNQVAAESEITSPSLGPAQPPHSQPRSPCHVIPPYFVWSLASFFRSNLHHRYPWANETELPPFPLLRLDTPRPVTRL